MRPSYPFAHLALALTLAPPEAGLPALKAGFSPYARLSSSQAHVEACSPSMGPPTVLQTSLRDMSVHKTEETLVRLFEEVSHFRGGLMSLSDIVSPRAGMGSPRELGSGGTVGSDLRKRAFSFTHPA